MPGHRRCGTCRHATHWHRADHVIRSGWCAYHLRAVTQIDGSDCREHRPGATLTKPAEPIRIGPRRRPDDAVRLYEILLR